LNHFVLHIENPQDLEERALHCAWIFSLIHFAGYYKVIFFITGLLVFFLFLLLVHLIILYLESFLCPLLQDLLRTFFCFLRPLPGVFF
jgi:hypothetical protein